MRKEVWCVGSLDMDAMAVQTKMGEEQMNLVEDVEIVFWCTWKFGKF